MLLVVDVGNTHIACGVYLKDGHLLGSFRLASNAPRRSADELAVLLERLLASLQVKLADIVEVLIASVVPLETAVLYRACDRLWARPPVLLDTSLVASLIPLTVAYQPLADLGVDRLINAAMAYERYHQGLLIIDLGTATTFNIVTPAGVYLGGAIAPGFYGAAESLFKRTANLLPIDLAWPAELVSPIGNNTTSCLQTGILFGYQALLRGMIANLCAHLDFKPLIIATGGLTALFAQHLPELDHVEPNLVLDGLFYISQLRGKS